MGFCTNVIVKDAGDISWHLQLGSAFIPSFILGIFFCPESPRWLTKHGKIAKGYSSMRRLRAYPIIGARDYYHSYVIYMEDLKLARGAGYFARLCVNYGVSTVMLVQQLCGISSKLPLVLRQVVPANGLQSSLSTAPVSFGTSIVRQNRPCIRLWAMALFIWCSPFLFCS